MSLKHIFLIAFKMVLFDERDDSSESLCNKDYSSFEKGDNISIGKGEHVLIEPLSKSHFPWLHALLCFGSLVQPSTFILKGDKQVEQLRDDIEDHRQRWARSIETWEVAVQMCQLRQVYWALGKDVPGWEKDRYFCFDTKKRYEVNTDDHSRAALAAPLVLDFRTPEARRQACQWFAAGCKQQQNARAKRMAEYDAWESRYQLWKKGKGSYLRKVLARRRLISSVRVPSPAHCSKISFRALPN